MTRIVGEEDKINNNNKAKKKQNMYPPKYIYIYITHYNT